MIRTLVRGASSKSHAVSVFEVSVFFGHLVVFCQCGLESLEVLEILVMLAGWVILPVTLH